LAKSILKNNIFGKIKTRRSLMTMTINVPKNKVSFMTAMFKNLPFVGLGDIYDENEAYLEELRESVREVK